MPPLKPHQTDLSAETKSATSSGDIKRARLKVWFLYAADWITVVVVTVVSQLILIPWPASVTFIVTDPNIQQRFFTSNTVDIDRVCVVLTTAVPTVIMTLWLGYFRRPLDEIHRSLLGLGLTMSFCTLFGAICKQMVYTPSADFLDRCNLRQGDFERSFRTGAPLSYQECQNRNIKRELRLYPATVVTLSSCSMAYLSLFLSVQLGLRLHPHVRRQLRQIDPDESIGRSRPGQTLISFVCLLPIAAGMAFPAVQTKYQGGGHGWGYGFSTILGYIFALWGHILYCSDLQVAVVLPPYV